MHRVIFVCTGNICRSPMAERIFAAELRQRGLPGVALSMSTLMLQGRHAASNAIAALAEIDIDLRGHVSQGLSVGLLQRASAILVMEPTHREAVLAADPALDARIELLGRFDPDRPSTTIEDPVGQDLDAFRACRDRLVRCIHHWLDVHGEP
ncbi:MAG: hypothetical protein H6698_01330 [Myxococcales bacterium]|nr:hypothetical protein [Myxococcales bacterium]MCB9532952.1 hypothetical protein [Myxococcales bacterium]